MRNSNLAKYLTDTFLSASALIRLVAVILLSAGFAYLNRVYLTTEMYEVGDFAANSLLIQHAKHLELFVGNYSRVGFNHPGPAILYVLALGEWLFYDCLGWVKAPFAGQMIAQGAYSAFWIVMLGTLLLRMYKSIAVAAVALILLITATVYFDYNIVTGLWFPHLYYFPFATFTLALILAIAGRGDTLVILALSCGFLIHGHVSFVAICGLMLAGGLWINSRAASQDLATTRILSKSFLTDFQTQLWVVGILFILFSSPLVLETIRHFPGPIANYLSFSSGNRPHSFNNALQFATDYWKIGFTPILIAILALLFFARGGSSAASKPSTANYARATTAAMLLATAALVLYAMYGVDHLTLNYIGIFYYAAPALTLALMLASFLLLRPRAIQVAVAVVIAAIALPYTVRQISKPVGYASNYHDARMAQYFKQVQTLGDETIVLDLDNSQDWGPIWSTLLGIEIYSARHRSAQLFCINRNWHISFSSEALCTVQQIQRGNRYIVSTSTKLAEILQASVTNLDNIHIYKYQPPTVATGKWLNVADNAEAYSTGILDGGWSLPGGGFVWSEGKQATLSFIAAAQTPPTRLKLDLGAFLPTSNSRQDVDITINGVDAGSIHFDAKNNRAVHEFTLPSAAVTQAGVITIQLNIRAPVSPQTTMKSDDRRLLGVALYGLAIDE